MADVGKKQRGLGRGLSALMADIDTNPVQTGTPSAAVRSDGLVAIEKIHPNPEQPRRNFDPEHLQELTDSIRAKGIIQPLVVRPHPNKPEEYEIVAGERRWRASQNAQLHELPVVVREFSDLDVLEIAIIENIQRADLNPIEEAIGYKQLMEKFGHTQDQLATALGKSRPHIANLLRLLSLPEDVQSLVINNKLSSGHARALITAPNASDLAKAVVAKRLSVREVEALVKKAQNPKRAGRGSKPKEKDADTKALEGDLSAALKMNVSVDHKPGKENGILSIRYKSLEELDDLCRALGSG